MLLVRDEGTSIRPRGRRRTLPPSRFDSSIGAPLLHRAIRKQRARCRSARVASRGARVRRLWGGSRRRRSPIRHRGRQLPTKASRMRGNAAERAARARAWPSSCHSLTPRSRVAVEMAIAARRLARRVRGQHRWPRAPPLAAPSRSRSRSCSRRNPRPRGERLAPNAGLDECRRVRRRRAALRARGHGLRVRRRRRARRGRGEYAGARRQRRRRCAGCPTTSSCCSRPSTRVRTCCPSPPASSC